MEVFNNPRVFYKGHQIQGVKRAIRHQDVVTVRSSDGRYGKGFGGELCSFTDHANHFDIIDTGPKLDNRQELAQAFLKVTQAMKEFGEAMEKFNV